MVNNYYDFCREWYLPPEDLLINCGLPISNDGLHSECRGRLLRILDDKLIQLSCPVPVFDRWSNSVDRVFDITDASDRKDLVTFIEIGFLYEEEN